MKKLYALYLAVIAVAVVGVSLHYSGFALDDATLPLSDFASDFTAFVVNLRPIAVLFLVFVSFFYLGKTSFVKLFYHGFLPSLIGSIAGIFSFLLYCYSSYDSENFDVFLRQPITVSLFAFWGFIVLAVIGRLIFLPRQKPEKNNTKDGNNASTGTGIRHGSGSV